MLISNFYIIIVKAREIRRAMISFVSSALEIFYFSFCYPLWICVIPFFRIHFFLVPFNLEETVENISSSFVIFSVLFSNISRIVLGLIWFRTQRILRGTSFLKGKVAGLWSCIFKFFKIWVHEYVELYLYPVPPACIRRISLNTGRNVLGEITYFFWCVTELMVLVYSHFWCSEMKTSVWLYCICFYCSRYADRSIQCSF